MHRRLTLWRRLVRFWDQGSWERPALEPGPGLGTSIRTRLLLEMLEERSHPGQTAGVLGFGIMGTGLGLLDRTQAPQAPASSAAVVRSEAGASASQQSSDSVSVYSTAGRSEEVSTTGSTSSGAEAAKSKDQPGDAGRAASTGDQEVTDDPLADPLASEWTSSHSSAVLGGGGAGSDPTTDMPGGGSGGSGGSGAHPSSASGGAGGMLQSPAGDALNQGGGASAPTLPAAAGSRTVSAPAIQPAALPLGLTPVRAALSTVGQAIHPATSKAATQTSVALGAAPVVSTVKPPIPATSPSSVSSLEPRAPAKVKKPITFTTTNTSGISGTGQSFTVQEGVNWSGSLVTNVQDVSGETFGQKGVLSDFYTASIVWGDGTTGSGTVSG
jgi:hypothetical protein